ncbi:heavy metal translocating P-type ATPase, partial [bacterium]
MDHSHHHEQSSSMGHGDHVAPRSMVQAAKSADHHAHNVDDFKRRFWVSLITTIPILGLSPTIQRFLGLGDALR